MTAAVWRSSCFSCCLIFLLCTTWSHLTAVVLSLCLLLFMRHSLVGYQSYLSPPVGPCAFMLISPKCHLAIVLPGSERNRDKRDTVLSECVFIHRRVHKVSSGWCKQARGDTLAVSRPVLTNINTQQKWDLENTLWMTLRVCSLRIFFSYFVLRCSPKTTCSAISLSFNDFTLNVKSKEWQLV